MRDGILLCRGKTNEDWNYSTAHGSGRQIPRNIAKQKLTLRDFEKTMIDVYSTSVSKSTMLFLMKNRLFLNKIDIKTQNKFKNTENTIIIKTNVS